MPASTRQATPGPSTILQPHTTQSVNSRKRAASEVGVEERDTKKLRAETTMGNVNGTPTSAKDKKKKKRKKRKRTSVVLQDPPMEHRRVRSSSRSVAPPSNTSTIVRRQATPNAEPIAGTPNPGTLEKETEEEEPVLSSSDKGKGKAKSDSPPPSHPCQPTAAPIAGPSSPILPESSAHASEVVRLKAQLAEQTMLLKRHQTHLNHHQQSLTCQICLDLMHKPYALAPCGHITCYGCLVRWFTAPQNPQQQQHINAAGGAEPHQDSIEHILNSPAVRNGAFLRRRKNCPVCRAVVQERPIEMWGIKSMVAALVRSELTDLPAPADPPPAAAGGAANNGRDNNNDPWRNVFRRVGARNNYAAYMDQFGFHPAPPQNPNGPGGAGPNGADADREQLGWFDMEDGGIYRCIDCYHEIWEGVCTSCNRRYPGHNHLDDDDDDIRFDDSDDDDEDDDGHGYAQHFRGGIGRLMEAMMGEEFDDEDDEEEEEAHLDRLLEIQEVDEEIQARVEELRQLQEAEDYNLRWQNHDDDVVALLELAAGDVSEEEDEDLYDDYDDRPWYARPVRRHQVGGARIEEVVDDEEDDDEGGGDEEDSQYGGSFIDDQAIEENAHELVFNADSGSDDEVEFFEPPRQHNFRRPAPRPHVVVDSSDDEDDDDWVAEHPRHSRLAQRLDGFYVEHSDDDDDDGDSLAEQQEGVDHISEEEDEFPIVRRGGAVRRPVYVDSESDG